MDSRKIRQTLKDLVPPRFLSGLLQWLELVIFMGSLHIHLSVDSWDLSAPPHPHFLLRVLMNFRRENTELLFYSTDDARTKLSSEEAIRIFRQMYRE
jgi:hypothetical protein